MNGPSITAPGDIALGCVPSAGLVPQPNAFLVTAVADCGLATVTWGGDSAAMQMGCNTTILRTYIATDNCGITNSAIQRITYTVDLLPPSIASVPAGTNFGCVMAWPLSAPDTNAVVGSDDSAIVRTEMVAETATTNGCDVSVTRLWEVEDCCGKTDTESATFTFTWKVNPAIISGQSTLALGCIDDAGQVPQASITPLDADSDCPIGSFDHLSDGPTLTTGCSFSFERLYEVTDNCGQQSVFTQLVTYSIDNEIPKITATQSGGDLGCAPVTLPAVDTNLVSASDNCGIASIVWHCDITNVVDCLTTITRIYRVTDLCGNQVDSEVIYTYTTDTLAPLLIAPVGFGDVDLGCNPVATAIPTINPAQFGVDDDCATVAVVHEGDTTETDGCFGTITRVYSATDGCGNRSAVTQLIDFIVDVDAPEPSIVPASMDLGCATAADVPAPDASVTAVTGMCSAIVATNLLTEVSTNTGCEVVITRLYTITDACGNVGVAEQTITYVTDGGAPILTCPADVDLACNASLPAPNPALVTVSDACSAATVRFVEDTTVVAGNQRMVTRTYEAEDGCGNIGTCQQIFTFAIDDVDPVITSIPQGLHLGCNPTSFPTPSASDIIASDDNGVVSTSVVLVVTNITDCQGRLTHRYRVEDACGNHAEAQVDYTFTVDTEPPSITCPTREFVETVDSNCEALMPAVFPIVTDDNCDGVVMVTQNPPAGALLRGPGVHNVTITARDACGHEASCVVQVTVEGECQPNPDPGTPVLPAIELNKTVYAGHDGGAQCGTAAASEMLQSTNGAPVTYCFQIVNTGPTGLELIFLDDRDLRPAVLRQVTPFLGMGESITTFEESSIGASLTNLASITAVSSIDGTPVADTDTAVVFQVNPAISLEKTVAHGHDAPCPGVELIDGELGDDVTWCFEVTNTGDVDLMNVVVNDPLIGISIPIPGLLTVGEVQMVSANGGLIGGTNTATAQGVSAFGFPAQVSDVNPAAAISGCGCSGGNLFVDVDGDGSPTDENLDTLGLANIVVNLYEYNVTAARGITGSRGALIASATTDTRGSYLFEGLVSGFYMVEVDASTIPATFNNAFMPALESVVEIGICECNPTTFFPFSEAPTAILVESLTATPTAGGIDITWATGDERDTLGFQVLKDGKPIHAGLDLAGDDYTVSDADAKDGEYTLVEIFTDLSQASYGPVSVVDAAPVGDPVEILAATDGAITFTAAEGVKSYFITGFDKAPTARSGSTTFRSEILETDNGFGIYLSIPVGTEVTVR